MFTHIRHDPSVSQTYLPEDALKATGASLSDNTKNNDCDTLYCNSKPVSRIETGPSNGPLTHSHSFTDILNYARSRSKIHSRQLSVVCEELQKNGLYLTKVTRKKKKLYLFKLNTDNSKIIWRANAKFLPLDCIKDIRVGKMASNYREEYNISEEFSPLWITIIYTLNKKIKAFHIIASNEDDFKLFFNCICGIVTWRRELMKSISLPDNKKFAKIHWHTTVSSRKEDETKDTLQFDQVKKLCDKFHIYCSSDYLKRIFDLADVNNNQLLNFGEFQIFVKLLKERYEIKKIWRLIATNNSNRLTLDEFKHFLVEIQKEDTLSSLEINQLFEKYKTEQNFIDEDAFTRYLNEQPYLNNVLQTTDHSKPLNHYFIASSHNTYLLGKQIADAPSVEAYIQVLQQGCRCIEIDIWDGDQGPVVCHGVLTSSIPLSNVVEVIKKYAFITSPYPLIVSLEINCNKENQKIASDLMKNILGKTIYSSQGNDTTLPSPAQLKHQIILKVKKPKTSNILPNDTISNSFTLSSSSVYEYTSFSLSSSTDSENDSNSNSKLEIANNAFSTDNSTFNVASALNTTGITRIRRIGIKKKIEIAHDIFEISGIHGVKFRNFSLPESKSLRHCFSLNEKKFDSLCKKSLQELSVNKHNRRHLMRVYPHPFRYKSSNFNPIKFWKLGVQMVATNWQTNDAGQQINLAMFQLINQKNGIMHSGYLLKPKSLLNPVSKIRDIPLLYKELSLEHPEGYQIKIKVLSAQLLPRVKKETKLDNKFGPYAIIEFIDDESSIIEPVSIIKNGMLMSNTHAHTPVREGNGFNPIWETELEIKLKSLDFAFIRFTVNTHDTPLATCCLKLEYLSRGYRHIPLYNMDGEQYIFSTLFIYSDITKISI